MIVIGFLLLVSLIFVIIGQIKKDDAGKRWRRKQAVPHIRQALG